MKDGNSFADHFPTEGGRGASDAAPAAGAATPLARGNATRKTLDALREQAERVRNAPTRTQVRIVEFVRAYRLKNDRGPTFEEIGSEVGLQSKSTVARNVKALIGQRLLLGGARHLHRSLKVPPEHPLTIDFPDDVFARLWVAARRRNVSPDAAVVEAVAQWLDRNSEVHRSYDVPHPALRRVT